MLFRSFALALASNGEVLVAGYAYSSDLPGTTGGAQAAHAGNYDGFVARLSGNLQTLVQSSYLGGSNYDEIRALAAEPAPQPPAEFPFVLSAGERRSYTANTIFRNPDWRRKDRSGALALNPADAARLGLVDGARARLVTQRGQTEVTVACSDRMSPGHVSLPNGQGIDYPDAAGHAVLTGTAPNELTRLQDRDAFAGTPWHKWVPARIEAL